MENNEYGIRRKDLVHMVFSLVEQAPTLGKDGPDQELKHRVEERLADPDDNPVSVAFTLRSVIFNDVPYTGLQTARSWIEESSWGDSTEGQKLSFYLEGRMDTLRSLREDLGKANETMHKLKQLV